jgi:hypothetical protein
MLSVGREINIENKNLLCRKCTWQGRGAEVSTGLIRVNRSDIYVYAYRCPVCESFDLASKGKLLRFRSGVTATMPDTIEQSADDQWQSADLRRRN